MKEKESRLGASAPHPMPAGGGGRAGLWRERFAGPLGPWVLAVAASAAFWSHPSSGLATVVCVGVGLHGLWRRPRLQRAWANPVGASFLALALVVVASLAWSVYPKGTFRDIAKLLPLMLGVLGLPAVATSRRRIWIGLLLAAGFVTSMLVLETFRLVGALGLGPALLEQARYTQPYLYTHPNVSSMMAGLCVFVFGGRLVAGVADRRQAAALVAGAAICLGYLWMMGSRGPQAVFAMTALAAPAVLLPGWRARAAAVLAAGLVALALWSAMGVVNPRFKDVATMRRYNNRAIVWNHTSMLLREWSPWVGFGFGKKAFKRAYYENPNQRAPFTPDRNLIFPHAHSYWRMVRFEGGWLGLAVCLAAWAQLAFASARAMMRASRRARARGWMAALRARGLGGTLATCLGFILLYGVWDYPDHLIRHSQFLLLALLAAWNAMPHED